MDLLLYFFFFFFYYETQKIPISVWQQNIVHNHPLLQTKIGNEEFILKIGIPLGCGFEEKCLKQSVIECLSENSERNQIEILKIK